MPQITAPRRREQPQRGPDGRFLPRSTSPPTSQMAGADDLAGSTPANGSSGSIDHSASPSGQEPTSAAGLNPEAGTSTPNGLMFSPAQVAFLLQNGFGSRGTTPAASQNTSSPITSSSFPQFVPPTNAPSPAGTSLIKLFPHVEASVLLEIARHEFKPSDLSKLDSKYRDRNARSVLEYDAGVGGFTIREPSAKEYPSLHSVFAPFTTYFHILTMFAASSGSIAAVCQIVSGSFAYIAQLEQFNEDYQWAAVLAYHMDFHYRRRSFMPDGDYSGWDIIDPGLQAKHLLGKERPRNTAATRSLSLKANSSPHSSPQGEVCRLFNKGACTSPCRYKRIHKCSSCSSADHGQANCTKTSGTAAPSGAARPDLSDTAPLVPPSITRFSSLLPHAQLFPPGPPPPARPNTDPRCNSHLLRSGDSRPANSSLQRDVWAAYLTDYPDQHFVSSLLHIIDFGAALGFIGSAKSQDCRNLTTALDHPATVSADIAALLPRQRIHGPFPAPPLEHFRSSPLGVVSRPRNPSKLRVIHHLSWPHGDSVNDGIPDSESHISYESFDSAVAAIRRLGPGTLLAKLDLKDAFRQIPVRQQDWPLLGCHWLGEFYYHVVLVFGAKSAPYIFNLFAEALHWIITRHIPATLRHYLEDFLPIFPPTISMSRANAAVEWVMGLGSQLGLEFPGVKTIFPCTALEFLGLELDTIAMEARMPADKLTWLGDLLTSWRVKRTCRLRELQGLIGFLQFASQVIPHARAFIRRLIDFSATFRSDFATRHIPAYARRDIHWWSVFHSTWNGIRLITPSRPTLHVYTDASGAESKGIGGIFQSSWFASRVPRRFRRRDIQFKEIYAALQAAMRWGNLWSGHHVVFHIDNQVIVDAIETDRNRSRTTMSVLRTLIMIAACLDFSFSSVWLPSKENALADAASRFHTRKTYSTGQRSFIDFLQLRPALLNADGTFLPASQRAIMEWVAFLGGRSLQPKTIKSYLTSVRSLHVDADLPWTACESLVVQRLIRGIKRFHGEQARNPKLPITIDLLRRLCESLLDDCLSTVSFRAAITLAFAGFLRCGEFTVDKPTSYDPISHLSRGSVQFLPSASAPTHLVLSLPSSKTDPFRKGVSILIAAAPDAVTCPINALCRLYQLHPQPHNAPLLPALDDIAAPLTRPQFITQLKAHLTSLGLDSSNYSGHSFRRGAATSAAAVGYADHEIQQLGRWRSDAYKLYIDIPRDRILHLSSRLHWADPLTQTFEPPSLPFVHPLA
ncbi:hypothetical protein ACG7TL_008187 [Trametes sanguinea]